MKYFLLASVLLVSQNVNCQLLTDSLLVDNHYRTFKYFQPEGPIANGALVFLMHGSSGSSSDIIKKTGRLQAIAGQENLLVVYPDAYRHYWNECRKYSTSESNKENINEEEFFTAMINYFQTKFDIRTNKIYAAGFSGGGHMAYKLGLTMPDKISGIAAVVANLPDSGFSDCKAMGKPLPVLIINGTADNVNPYYGGEMFVNNNSFGVVRSTENTFAYWASLSGYTGTPGKEIQPDTDPADQKIIERYSYSQPGKPPVVLLKVVGGKHDYPNDIDVYLYVWAFFKALK